MAQAHIAELAVESGFPPGVLNVVHGGRSVSEALLEDPRIAGNFVCRIIAGGAGGLQARHRCRQADAVSGSARRTILWSCPTPAWTRR